MTGKMAVGMTVSKERERGGGGEREREREVKAGRGVENDRCIYIYIAKAPSYPGRCRTSKAVVPWRLGHRV